jgi:uncharacterized protein YdeI (YjbR/CyaY-like superfamily)
MAKAFKTQADFRRWLQKHHATEKELMMRLFKVHAKERGIGYREALDEALCWGWIDGVRRSLDEDSFTQRFTPRKKKSNWSAVNIKRAKELVKEGRMCAPGLAAFEARDRTAISPYSFESGSLKLDPALEKRFRANKTAWEFFQAQPPGYRKLMTFRIMTAKREETRAKRLQQLLDVSAKKRRVGLVGE